MGLISLKDWTTYVFAGIAVGAGMGILWYNVTFDIYKTEDAQDKQFNEMKTGDWRLGHQPNMGAEIQVGNYVVFQIKGSEGRRVGRVVALEGSKVEVKGDEVLVDGNPATNPTKSTRSRFDVPELTVPRRCYFVLADQRGKSPSESYDSRHLGPIPHEAITHTFKPLKAGG